MTWPTRRFHLLVNDRSHVKVTSKVESDLTLPLRDGCASHSTRGSRSNSTVTPSYDPVYYAESVPSVIPRPAHPSRRPMTPCYSSPVAALSRWAMKLETLFLKTTSTSKCCHEIHFDNLFVFLQSAMLCLFRKKLQFSFSLLLTT